jgi:Circularly permutated YpsA SLOG family
VPAHAACAPSAGRARAAADLTTSLKIISGGQTGVDRGALDAALELGNACGGWCPTGRLAEDGKIPDRYPVMELPDGGYAGRTARNVADSDGTLIITNGPLVGGTRETAECCVEIQKPRLVIDGQTASIEEATERAAGFVLSLSSRAHARDLANSQSATEHSQGSSPSARLGMTVALNVAGPRASEWPNGHVIAHEIVAALLQRLSGHRGGDAYSA